MQRAMHLKLSSPSMIDDASLANRQIRVVASDATPDRIGDVMEPMGCVIENS